MLRTQKGGNKNDSAPSDFSFLYRLSVDSDSKRHVCVVWIIDCPSRVKRAQIQSESLLFLDLFNEIRNQT